MGLNGDQGNNVSPTDKKNTADEAALEFTKQLITLASGALVLSATFIEKLGELNYLLIIILGLSWILLLVSVYYGLETISAIVKSRLDNDIEWSKGYGKTSAKRSKNSFVLGITLFIAFAFVALLIKKNEDVKLPQQKCICIPDTIKKYKSN